MNGWMTCNFMSFSTVFRSYQGNGRMIMKGCMQWNPVSVEKILPQVGLELWTARLVGQRITHRVTGAPLGIGPQYFLFM